MLSHAYTGKTQRLITPTTSVLQGRFEVGKLEARTSMSRIFEGHDRITDLPVVVKWLAPGDKLSNLPRSQAIALFRQEARVLARLRTIHAPRLIDAMIGEDDAYLVLERIEGATLADLLKSAPLSREFALQLCRSICAQVIALHAHQPAIVHADLSAKNIIAGRDGRVWLLDFALARESGAAPVTSLPAGTTQHMSPEQIRNVPLDVRADIYALGKLFHCLLKPTAGSELDAVLKRATAWELEDRYATALHLRVALHSATVEQQSITVTTQTAPKGGTDFPYTEYAACLLFLTCIVWLILMFGS